MCVSYHASVASFEYPLELPLSTLEYLPSTPQCSPVLARSGDGTVFLAYHGTHTKAYTYPYVCVYVCNYLYTNIDQALSILQSLRVPCAHGVLMMYSWGTCVPPHGVLAVYSRRACIRGRALVAAALTLAPSRAPTTATPTSSAAPECPSRRPHAHACHCFCISCDRCAWKGVHGYARNTPIAGFADRRTHTLDSSRPRVPPEYPLSTR